MERKPRAAVADGPAAEMIDRALVGDILVEPREALGGEVRQAALALFA